MNTFNEWLKAQDSDDIICLVAVPRKFYDKVSMHQIIYYDKNKWDFFDGEQPVVLKGATECRIAKYNSPSIYLAVLWERYIKLKKLTEVRYYEWAKIVYKLPLPRRKFASNSIEAARPFYMCNQFNNVLIKGKSYFVENPERLQIIKDIFDKSKKATLP
jgi:hypothetical protein